MAEEIKQLLTLSNFISDPIHQKEKKRKQKKKNGKRKFDVPSREVLALTGTTYPMMPVRPLTLRAVKIIFEIIYSTIEKPEEKAID